MFDIVWLQNFYGRHELVDSYGVSIYTMKTWSTCPFLFRLPRTWLFMSNSATATWKAEDAYPTGALGPRSQFLVEYDLLYFLLPCMYYFISFMLFVVFVWFPCIVFVPRLHSFDWFPLESWFPWLLFQAHYLALHWLVI